MPFLGFLEWWKIFLGEGYLLVLATSVTLFLNKELTQLSEPISLSRTSKLNLAYTAP